MRHRYSVYVLLALAAFGCRDKRAPHLVMGEESVGVYEAVFRSGLEKASTNKAYFLAVGIDTKSFRMIDPPAQVVARLSDLSMDLPCWRDLVSIVAERRFAQFTQEHVLVSPISLIPAEDPKSGKPLVCLSMEIVRRINATEVEVRCSSYNRVPGYGGPRNTVRYVMRVKKKSGSWMVDASTMTDSELGL